MGEVSCSSQSLFQRGSMERETPPEPKEPAGTISLPTLQHRTGPPAATSQHPHLLSNCLHQALPPHSDRTTFPATLASVLALAEPLSQKTGSNPLPTLQLPTQEFCKSCKSSVLVEAETDLISQADQSIAS